MDAQDVEVRLWQGFGLGGSWGTVLRRTGGRWHGWTARVATCHYSVSSQVDDTLTPPGVLRYQRLAKERCAETDAGEKDAPRDTYSWVSISIDTVGVVPLESTATLPEVWTDLVRAGVVELPMHVTRSWLMHDGHAYVVEVRRGDEYRASVIEHTSPPATRADSMVQAVAGILRRVSPPRL